MTIPNQLTILRILLIPVMVIIIMIDELKVATNFLDLNLDQLLFTILFMLGCLTDFFDGYLARKLNQVTTFGKFLDPIADKMIVFVALIYLLVIPGGSIVSYWSVILILMREFVVTGVRLIAVEESIVIAASKTAKYKTASTMVAIILILFNGFEPYLPFYVTAIIFYLAIGLTVISGFEYLYKNRKIIFKSF